MTRLSMLHVLTEQLLKCRKQGRLGQMKRGKGGKMCLSCALFGYWYVLKTRFGVCLSCCTLHVVATRLICWRKLVKLLLLLLFWTFCSAFTVMFPGKLPSSDYADFNPFRWHATCAPLHSPATSTSSTKLFSWPNCEGRLTVCVYFSKVSPWATHQNFIKIFALYDLA